MASKRASSFNVFGAAEPAVGDAPGPIFEPSVEPRIFSLMSSPAPLWPVIMTPATDGGVLVCQSPRLDMTVNTSFTYPSASKDLVLFLPGRGVSPKAELGVPWGRM